MARVGGLGKGLDSLIPNKSGENGNRTNNDKEAVKRTTVKTARNNRKEAETASKKNNDEYKDFLINISKVEPNPEQPRKEFDQNALEELAESIKVHGIIQPLVVMKKENHYEIVSGERRWRAAKIAGLKSVPVVVKNLTQQQAMEISLIENLQREDLNPLEEASGYQQLMTTFSLTQDEVSKKVGKSRTAVANSLRLLKLDSTIQSMIINKQISMGHARALLSLDSFDDQYDLAMRIIEEQLSVRETEDLIRKLKEDNHDQDDNTPTEEKSPLDLQIEREYKEFESNLNKIMGTKVRIKQKKNNKGKIEIEYFSLDEFERIYRMLQEIPEGQF